MVFVISLFLLHVLLKTVLSQDSEIVFVHVIFRHGDRSPIRAYPSDPYGNESFWPSGFGQLTNRGKNQQYELGKWLRNRYKAILPEKYSLHDIYVRSSDYDRTIMSAMSNLAGLYEPNGTDVWNPNITWQPIPVHTEKLENDIIITEDRKCRRFELEMENLLETEEMIALKNEMEPLLKYLANSTGVEKYDYQTLITTYDNLLIQSIYNYTLPKWSKDVFPYPLQKYSDLHFKLDSYNLELQRLHTGPLLNEIIDRFINKTKNELIPNRKMWIYSAHDRNMVNLLNVFDNYDPTFPINYASTILMELITKNETYYVATFYKNDTKIYPLNVKGCELLCPLDRLIELLEPILITPDEWEAECLTTPVPKALTIIGVIGICCGVVLVIIFISFCCRRMYLNRYKVAASQ